MKHTIIQFEGKEYIPLVYNNFKALGAEQFIDPPQPNVAVPFFRDIADVLDEAHILEMKHNQQINSIGLDATYENKLKLPFSVLEGSSTRNLPSCQPATVSRGSLIHYKPLANALNLRMNVPRK